MKNIIIERLEELKEQDDRLRDRIEFLDSLDVEKTCVDCMGFSNNLHHELYEKRIERSEIVSAIVELEGLLATLRHRVGGFEMDRGIIVDKIRNLTRKRDEFLHGIIELERETKMELYQIVTDENFDAHNFSAIKTLCTQFESTRKEYNRDWDYFDAQITALENVLKINDSEDIYA